MIKQQTQTSGGIKKLRAINFEPPFIVRSDDDESHSFFVRYINDGTLHDVQCTKEVFRNVEKNKFDLLLDKEFILDYDTSKAIVVRVSVLPRAATGTFDEQEVSEYDDKKSKSKYLILQKNSDNTSFTVKVKPESMLDEDISDILSEVNSEQTSSDPIKSDDIIAGKFIVSDVRRNGTYVYIDSNPV